MRVQKSVSIPKYKKTKNKDSVFTPDLNNVEEDNNELENNTTAAEIDSNIEQD